jgi:hypothetical protein
MNYIYEQIQKIFITEEESLKNFINNFFSDYDDIINEYKIIFTLHLQKIDSENEDLLYEKSLCHSKILLNSNQIAKIKKNKYKYKISYYCENYKQQNKLFFVNIFIPDPSYGSIIARYVPDSFKTTRLSSDNTNNNCMIYQKYYYNIYLYENKIMNFIKEYKYNNKNYEEITLKSVVTEIIDIVIKT